LFGLHAWIALAAAVGLGWLLAHFAVRTILASRVVLGSRSYDGPPCPAPRISVVLAAKDEQRDLEPCVTALLGQDYPDFELTVVDDRSRDRTPAILRRLRRRHGDRVQVLTVKRLRDGWTGKNNAMREGVAASTGPWLLFTDADCRITSTRALAIAMREALDTEADLFSIAPVLEARTWWERVLQPAWAFVLMTWFMPHRVNDPRQPTAYANGAFMLMRKDAYEAIGGHVRVPGAGSPTVACGP
jgi:glycosyltransferase involved in cell wall biosynthesis